MDMYTGRLSPGDIALEIDQLLKEKGITDKASFQEALKEEGYLSVTLSDEAVWILREAIGERYIHIHPGRHVPHTLRIKATALKTALAYQVAQREQRLTGDLHTDINQLRLQLSLSPVRNIKECRHLLELVGMLTD